MRLRHGDRLKALLLLLRFRIMFNNSYGAFSRRGPASMQIYRNKRKPVCIKKKTILELQDVRRFIVLEDQYGRRDVM